MAELSDRELDALARAISRRLRAVVPEGASPSVGAADVGLRLGELVNQAGSFEDNLVVASEAILSHAQDEIIRDLAEGWPRERDAGEDLPWPEAAVVTGTLRLWYGEARLPALELSPIPLNRPDADAQ